MSSIKLKQRSGSIEKYNGKIIPLPYANLFLNGNFEGSDYDFLDSEEEIIVTESESHTGTKSIIAYEAGFNKFTDVFEFPYNILEEGKLFTFGFWAKSTQNSDIEFGGAGGGGYFVFTIPANSDWTYYQASLIIPNVNLTFRYENRSEDISTDGKIYFDELTLVEGDVNLDPEKYYKPPDEYEEATFVNPDLFAT